MNYANSERIHSYRNDDSDSGIMSAVAIPRYERRIELAELRTEKDFTNQIWKELEL